MVWVMRVSTVVPLRWWTSDDLELLLYAGSNSSLFTRTKPMTPSLPTHTIYINCELLTETTSWNILSNWDNIIFELISLLTPTSASLTLNSRSSYLHLYPNLGIHSQKTTLNEGLTSLRQIQRNLWLFESLSALYMKNIDGGLGMKKNWPILQFTTPIPNLLNQISCSASVTHPKSGVHTASTRTTTTLIVISSMTPCHVNFVA